MCILNQIAWETQNWHQNFSRVSGSWVIDQNMNNIYSRTPRPTKIFML